MEHTEFSPRTARRGVASPACVWRAVRTQPAVRASNHHFPRLWAIGKALVMSSSERGTASQVCCDGPQGGCSVQASRKRGHV